MKRLLEESRNELAKIALHSARADAPSEEARSRTAAAVGAVVAVSAVAVATNVTSVAAGTTSVSAAALTGGATKTAAVSGSSLWTTVGGLPLAIKAVTGALAIGLSATIILHAPTATESARASAELRPHAEAAPAPAEARLLVDPVASVVSVGSGASSMPSSVRAGASQVSAAPSVVRAPRSQPVAASSGPAVDSASELTVAVSRLEEARRALSSGDPQRALAIVREYEKADPKGALVPEAGVLAIEALLASGANHEALVAADRFLADTPSSPHARRVRTLVAPLREREANP